MPFPRLAAMAMIVAAPALGAVRLHDIKTTTPAMPPKIGLRAELLHDLDDVEKKIISLATAMPADKYGWRPSRGVRSVSEVYMHMAGGNYALATLFGGKSPMADTRSLERITDKSHVIDDLRQSFDQLRDAIVSTPDGDLDKPIRMFGSDTTERAAFLTGLNHLHEHLGQSIAYARMNGVVPPWSTE